MLFAHVKKWPTKQKQQFVKKIQKAPRLKILLLVDKEQLVKEQTDTGRRDRPNQQKERQLLQ